MKRPAKGAAGDGFHGVTPITTGQPAAQTVLNVKAGVVAPDGASPIRILVVDDHPIVRRGLSSCLAGYPHLRIVGEAANGKEAILKANALLPDVVLMDIEMPKLDGLASTQVLAREQPKSKVLILSVHKDEQCLRQIMQAGALGYVSKEATPAELVQAIETVAGGNKFFGSNTAAMLKDSPPRKQLSPREQTVLAGIAEGLSNKEIASRLGLGVRTVETHRERLMRKLKIHHTAGLTRLAISLGLTFSPEHNSPAEA